jgi:integrase
MRPRRQSGQIFKRKSEWVLRYWEDQIRDGVPFRARITKIIGSVDEYRTKSDAANRATSLMISAGINNPNTSPDSSLTLGEFIEKRYFPHLEWRLAQTGEFHLEPSTLKGYRDVWTVHVEKSAIVTTRLRDFSTVHAQAFFNGLDGGLSHETHKRIKSFLSGVFSTAKQLGAFEGVNPVRDTKVGGGKKKFVGYAYSLEEVGIMLKKLPEPARTVCAVAAFTGLSASELRGLRWQDYTDGSLSVTQKVWGTHVGPPKTEARQGKVPVVPALEKILKAYRSLYPGNQTDFIFRGDKKNFALSLDNLSRRTITPILNDGWHGWHSFRRGLASRLFYAGTDGKTVQTILRHANISTTLAHYVVPDQDEVKAAMRAFGKVVRALTKTR